MQQVSMLKKCKPLLPNPRWNRTPARTPALLHPSSDMHKAVAGNPKPLWAGL